jgi:hypothetical protein
LTLVQLRNAGGYSLFKTGKVADSIALYESKNNDIKLQDKFYMDYGVQAWTSFKQIFDITLTKQFFNDYNDNQKIPSDIYVLISKDEVNMHVLFNNYWVFSSATDAYNNLLREHLEYLKGLITFLKRNYDIE